jgi:predicted nucleic acid-binding protein
LRELAHDGRQVLVAYPILLEAYSLLLYRLGRNAASGWLTEITNATFLNPTPADYHRAFATVQTLGDQRVSLVDATVAALATRLGLEVWTYDHHFDTMRARVWR